MALTNGIIDGLKNIIFFDRFKTPTLIDFFKIVTLPILGYY